MYKRQEQILAVTVGLADSVMIAGVGEAAVSGVSLVDTVMVLLINVFSALATGGAVSYTHLDVYKRQAVKHMSVTDKGMAFRVEGLTDAQVTVELEEDTDYKIFIDGEEAGEMKTNLGGKLVIGVELGSHENADIRIEKK